MFRTQFDEFMREFSEERSLVVATTSINMKAVRDLRQEYLELLSINAVLARLHYIAHASRSFTIDELQFPLKGIQTISMAASLGLFVKPNHKDRFAILIDFLRRNPDLFAQILYFALVAPSNPMIRTPDTHVFTTD